MNLIRISLLAFLLSGCDDFANVQKEDSIEGYLTYLIENPGTRYRMEAVSRLEGLYIEKARKDKTLSSYDLYLEKYPNGTYSDAAMIEREDFLFSWARSTHTAESWTKYLETYTKGYKDHRQAAKRGLKVAEYSSSIAISEPEITPVNLAEDPKGPLNGWGFTSKVTNNGDKTLQTLKLRIHYLDAEGKSLDQREWPVVASNWPLPVEPEYEKPMKPGDTRTWEWSTGDLPEGWANKARMEVSYVSYKSK